MNKDEDDEAVTALAASEAYAENAVEWTEDVGTGGTSDENALQLALVSATLSQAAATRALVRIGFGILDALEQGQG